jgi:hypothetical protein
VPWRRSVCLHKSYVILQAICCWRAINGTDRLDPAHRDRQGAQGQLPATMMSIPNAPPAPHTVSEPLLNRADALLALLVGGLSLALYVRTLVPFALVGDSAEFQVLAYQVGIAHTPGYPVYLLLAKLFTFLPIRDIAYRVNLFSAFMAAMTVSGVYLATRLLTGSRLAALFGGLALTVSFTFWSQAIVAEVYTSGAAFVTLVWLGLLAWYRTGKRRPLCLAGLCGGLSLGVHSTVALLAPASLLFLWLNRKRWPNFWPAAVLGAAAGTLLYLLAFIAVDLHAPPANIFNAAYAPARSSWNLSQADLDSPFRRMIFIGTATQWHAAIFADWRKLPGRLFEYVRAFPREFAWLTIMLVICGLAMLLWSERSLGWLFLTALLAEWAFALTYQISDYSVFYIIGYVLMAMLAAYAAGQAAGWLAKRSFRGARLLAIAALLAMLAAGVEPQLAPYWQSIQVGAIPFTHVEGYLVDDQSEADYRVVERVVDVLPPNAIVFVQWYQLYTYYYAAQIEKGRLDLRFVEPEPHADRPGLPGSLIEFIGANIATHPVFFIRRWDEVERAGYSFQARDIGFIRYYQLQRN